MIGARMQVGAALGVAAVALVAGLVMARGPGRGDALERFARVEADRHRARQAAMMLDGDLAKVTVDDPEPPPPELEPVDDRLVIEIPLDGDVVVSGQAISDDLVEAVLQAAFDRDPDTQIVLQPEAGVPHRRLIEIMERAKAVGLTRLVMGAPT